VIKRDGTIEQGRKETQAGAHVADWNSVSLGICMIGGVDANDHTKAVNNYTPAQWVSLKKLLLELKTRYPNAKIQGHRDFPKVAKACPCFDVATWLKAEKI
jgi:N-acetylmuramoyl-L-alanine amidase